MPVHFVLKRHLPGFEEYGDLYEAIKTGRKTSEYRDATMYWAKRLLSEKGLRRYREIAKPYDATYTFTTYRDELRHTEATFRVGYTRGPTLHATIKEIHWKPIEGQFEVRVENVREAQS